MNLRWFWKKKIFISCFFFSRDKNWITSLRHGIQIIIILYIINAIQRQSIVVSSIFLTPVRVLFLRVEVLPATRVGRGNPSMHNFSFLLFIKHPASKSLLRLSRVKFIIINDTLAHHFLFEYYYYYYYCYYYCCCWAEGPSLCRYPRITSDM
jgi:hypothetical protein